MYISCDNVYLIIPDLTSLQLFNSILVPCPNICQYSHWMFRRLHSQQKTTWDTIDTISPVCKLFVHKSSSNMPTQVAKSNIRGIKTIRTTVLHSCSNLGSWSHDQGLNGYLQFTTWITKILCQIELSFDHIAYKYKNRFWGILYSLHSHHSNQKPWFWCILEREDNHVIIWTLSPLAIVLYVSCFGWCSRSSSLYLAQLLCLIWIISIFHSRPSFM